MSKLKDEKDYLYKLRDPKFYLEHFCKIKTKTEGLQPFILKEAQKDIFNVMRHHHRIIILKARQLGFSTAITGFFYVDTIMHPGVTTALIGYNTDLVIELLDKVKTLYRTTPEELRPSVHFDSKYEMSFPTMESKILVLPNTKNVGRGLTLQNCLSGNSRVFVKHGKTKKIKDLKRGDYIVNGNGGLGKVKAVIKKKKNEKLLELDVVGSGKLRLTRDHKILTREFKTGKPKWMKVEDIVVGDWKNKIKNAYIAYPVFPVRNRFKKIKIKNVINKKYLSRSFVNKNEIKLDYNFGQLIGWYLAEGTVAKQKHKIFFSLNKNEVKKFVLLAEKFKGSYVSKISVYYSKTSKTAIVTLYGINLANFINEYFGRTVNKYINDCIWYWGKEFAKGLLYGLFSGDGSFKEDNKIVLTSTNESIIYQTKKLLISLRYGVPNIYINDKTYRYGIKNKRRYDLKLEGPGNYKFRKDFNLKLPPLKNWAWKWRIKENSNVNVGNKTWRRGKKYYWSKIRSIKEVEAEKYVYDISMEKKPYSFLTTEGVCHNCLVTELAMWEDAEEKMAGLMEAVPENGRLVIESCVSGDTIVFTDKGPRYVKTIHNWNKYKKGFSEGKLIKIDGHYGLQKTSTYYNSGIQNGFKVITKNGYELKMSSIHKLFVLKGDKLEFVKAENLKIGDLLVIKYGQELWGNNDKINWQSKKNNKQFNPVRITKNLAYLIGLILGSGFIYENDKLKIHSVVVNNKNKKISNFLLNNKLGLKFLKKGEKENNVYYKCINKSFVEFLQDYIGLKNKIKITQKEIPEIIFKWSRRNIIAFLQGLFDVSGNVETEGQISFISVSEKIINVLQSLLLNFGIITKTYSHVVKLSKRAKTFSKMYKLEIDKSFQQVFLDKIGFRMKRKQQDKREIIKSLEGYIPGLNKVIKRNAKKLGLYNSDLYDKNNNITYRTLKIILKKCRNKKSNEYKRIKELYDKKYFYDKIERIIPIKENVYDFTVNNGHTVVYNGFVGHQTPKGMNNLFYRMWKIDNEFVKKKYYWNWEYTEEQMKKKKEEIGELLFAQEYGCDFLSSGRNVFDTISLRRQEKNILKVGDTNKSIIENQEDFVVKQEEDWTIYRDPEKDGIYSIGVDVSEGVEGGDFSVAVIFDRRTGEEVAMYRGYIPPDRLGDLLNRWGRKYNNALLVVEVNNHGLTTITVLKQRMYPNLYFRSGKIETLGVETTDKIGWKTTMVTKPLLIDELSQALRRNEIIIHSEKTLDEMLSLVYNNNGDMTVPTGMHDDTIFATAIALQGFKKIFVGKLEQINEEEYLPKNFSY